ncbi:tetratricopeptide repeat domain protein [Treponema sp. R8-4-B8]
MKRQEKDRYGNVTFGEATGLLIDTIEQIVILDLVKKEGNKPEAYKKKLERIYDGQGTYSEFETATKGSPQWYFALFFKEILEGKYNVSPLAMIIVDSFTWQFFFALTWHTPFEKLKSKTVMFHLRKQVFCFIYNRLLKGIPLDDGSVYKISRGSIMEFLTDTYEKIFFDIDNDFKRTGNSFRIKIKEYWEGKYIEYPKLYKTVSLEEVLNELYNDGGIFYKELKDSYSLKIDDLRTEKPKLYELLSNDEKADNFTQLYKEAVEEFIENDLDTLKIIIEEIPKSKIKYPYFFDYNRSPKTNFNLDENILNWRNEDVYNPTWKILEPILDFLLKKGKTTHIHRLIGLYLLKNAKKAMEEILDISEIEQEKIIIDIVTMINENRKPEEFYTENDLEFLEQIDLIYMCLVYQHQEKFDPVKSDEIITAIESKCYNSKKFFSQWLKARAKVFEIGEKLKENKEAQDSIVDGYKKAFNEGIAYAGAYLGQFLLEAIVINRFCNPRQVKDINDYYGYGYALEMFGAEKQKLLNRIKETDDLRMIFVNIHSDFNPTEKVISSFPSRTEFYCEKVINMGLKFDKAGSYEQAIECLKIALLLNPFYVNGYYNRGNLYNKLGEQFTKNALANFNIALLLDPTHENTLFNRGCLLFMNGNIESAITDFTKLISIKPDDSEAYLRRGVCYKYMKYFDRAIEDYNKAIEINPRYAEAYYHRSDVYKLLGDNDKAKEDCCKAKQICPDLFF